MGLIGYGQESHSKPVADSGYYYGIVNDSLQNKHIFMSFLSNDGDERIYIVPYIQDTLKGDTAFMHENFHESLKNQNTDSIDGNVYLDLGWSIPGFDNYSYYTIEGDRITFSLNIAIMDTPFLDIFKFDGKFSYEGNTIEAIVSSTDSIFNLSVVILTYKKLEK